MNAYRNNQSRTHLGDRKAVIYVRISSAKQGKEGSGIHSQEQTCRNYARYKGFKVDHVFADVMTGRSSSRPDMNKMLMFLRQHRHENYAVVIPEISRLARDYSSYMFLRDEILESGGELFSPSIEFSDNPAERFTEKIQVLVSEQEVLTTSRRARAGEQARLTSGVWPFKPPTGFEHIKDPSGAGGKVLAQVEPVASVVKEALEKFASGYFETQIDVKRFLEDHPAFPKTSSGKIGKSRVSKMLRQVLYAGYLEKEDRGVPLTKARHEPLISFETYLKIQDRLDGKTKPAKRMLINPAYAIRGLVDCSTCDEPLKAGRSKSRNGDYHHYYSCHTKGCEHYGKSIRRDKIEGEFEDLLGTLRPSAELLSVATHMFQTVWERHVKAFKERQQAAQHSLSGLEKKIDHLVNRIVQTRQPSLISAYEAELGKLERQRISMTEKIGVAGQKNDGLIPDFIDAYRTAMAVVSNPIILWQNQDVRIKRAAVKYAFASRLKYDRNTGYRTAKASLPFQLLQSLSPPREDYLMKNGSVVGDTGIEPVTPAV